MDDFEKELSKMLENNDAINPLELWMEGVIAKKRAERDDLSSSSKMNDTRLDVYELN